METVPDPQCFSQKANNLTFTEGNLALGPSFSRLRNAGKLVLRSRSVQLAASAVQWGDLRAAEEQVPLQVAAASSRASVICPVSASCCGHWLLPSLICVGGGRDIL